MAATRAADAAAHASPPTLEAARLIGPRTPEARRFGEVTASDRDLIAIAAPTDGDDALEPGSVAIFRAVSPERGSLDLRFEHMFTSRPHASGEHFGASLAVSRACRGAAGADLVAVGADRARASGDDSPMSGTVEVFARAPNGSARWESVARLVPREPDAGASFGAAVAFDGAGAARLAVGAPRTDAAGAFDAGRVHVFRRVGGDASPTEGGSNDIPHVWREVATIEPPNPQLSGWFGSAVAVEDDLIAIAGPGADVAPILGSEPVHGAGAVYLYRRVAESSVSERYRLERVITAGSPEPSAWFGLSIALDRGILAIGAPRARDLATGSHAIGAVFILDLTDADDDGGPFLARIDPPATPGIYGFGQTLALRDRTLVIGAPSADLGVKRGSGAPIEDVGAAWVYSLARWEFTAELRAPRPLRSSLFGATCALALPAPTARAEPVVDTADREAPGDRALDWIAAPQQGAATRASAPDAMPAPPVIAIIGHRYIEEESVAPSPGAAVYIVPPQRTSKAARIGADNAARRSGSPP